MSRIEAAAGMDRLPWLHDEPQRPARDGNTSAGWAAAAFVLVAGTGLWIGARSSEVPLSPNRASTTTVPLPPARTAPASSIVEHPEVTPANRPERGAKPPVAQHPARSARPVAVETARMVHPAAPKHSASSARPSRATVGNSPAGALVEVGAFGSASQASSGWRSVVRAHPSLAHSTAVVSKSRNSKGRSYYRLQVRTRSQARSNVPCEGMRKIGFSCTVVGLPKNARVER
jgi:hypothetical protein